MTHSRYVLPSFVERTSHGLQESHPYTKPSEGRIVVVGTPIDDACAGDDIERDLFLTAEQAVEYGTADRIVPGRKPEK